MDHAQQGQNLEETILNVLMNWPRPVPTATAQDWPPRPKGPLVEELILPVMRRQTRPGYEIRNTILRMIEQGRLRAADDRLLIPEPNMLTLFED